jgi:hypothetical protein
MRKHNGPRFIAAATLVVGLAAGSALYAQDEQRPSRPDSTPGMTSEGGMMGMMRRMSRMMDQCAGMMGEGSRPNDQWRGDSPATPEKK